MRQPFDNPRHFYDGTLLFLTLGISSLFSSQQPLNPSCFRRHPSIFNPTGKLHFLFSRRARFHFFYKRRVIIFHRPQHSFSLTQPSSNKGGFPRYGLLRFAPVTVPPVAVVEEIKRCKKGARECPYSSPS